MTLSAPCPHCDNVNPVGQKFCGECGQPLPNGTRPLPAEDLARVRRSGLQIEYQPAQPLPIISPSINRNWWVWLLIPMLLLAVVIALFFLLSNKNTEGGISALPSQTPNELPVVQPTLSAPTDTALVSTEVPASPTSVLPSPTSVPPSPTPEPPTLTPTPIPPSVTPLPPSPTPILITEAGTILKDGETWYANGWSLQVSNFTYKTFLNPHFRLENRTGREVLYGGKEVMKLVSDAGDNWHPCSSGGIVSGSDYISQLGQREILQDGVLEWDWEFGRFSSRHNCQRPMFSPQARTLTLTVESIGTMIQNATWQTEIPRP